MVGPAVLVLGPVNPADELIGRLDTSAAIEAVAHRVIATAITSVLFVNDFMMHLLFSFGARLGSVWVSFRCWASSFVTHDPLLVPDVADEEIDESPKEHLAHDDDDGENIHGLLLSGFPFTVGE
jgi:hypothetical protein